MKEHFDWGDLIYDEHRQGYWRKSTINYHSSVSTSNMEQDSRNESLGKEKTPALDLPCTLIVASFRKRPSDVDGLSAKYVIDGIVHAGLLPDDTSKEIKEVRFQQRQSRQECTIITIY